MAKALQANVTVLRERQGTTGAVLEVLVRKYSEDQFAEVRVAVVGNVDSGKSTLLGVLTRGRLDNGRGLARLNVFRHQHEVESGRTSSISQEILGYDSTGHVTNVQHLRALSWTEICEASSKIVTFLDLAGHERYLKTTIYGLTGHQPDFAMLMIGANNGIVGMTREHLGIALALRVPVFVVITKIDMCPENKLNETREELTRLLKAPGCRKIPMFMANEDDTVMAARNFVSERICPIFLVSNVSGLHLDLLKLFLNLLPIRADWESAAAEPAQFHIDDIFVVPGVGTVASGTLMKGIVTAGQTLLLGPDLFGRFEGVMIKSIQTKRLTVRTLRAGQTGTFALKKVKRNVLRKGMVMLDKTVDHSACMRFDAEVLVLFHHTTIQRGYQAMIHCNAVRQTARIVEIPHVIRTGDRVRLTFEFMCHPEFIVPDARLVFREGRTKGIGKVVLCHPMQKKAGAAGHA